MEEKLTEISNNVRELNKVTKNIKQKITPIGLKNSINIRPVLPVIKSMNLHKEKSKPNEFSKRNEISISNINEISIKSNKKSPYYFNDPKNYKYIENKQILNNKKYIASVKFNQQKIKNKHTESLNINCLIDRENSNEDYDINF